MLHDLPWRFKVRVRKNSFWGQSDGGFKTWGSSVGGSKAGGLELRDPTRIGSIGVGR